MIGQTLTQKRDTRILKVIDKVRVAQRKNETGYKSDTFYTQVDAYLCIHEDGTTCVIYPEEIDEVINQ